MRISIDISEPLAKIIEKDANLNGRTRKWQIEFIIQQYYKFSDNPKIMKILTNAVNTMGAKDHSLSQAMKDLGLKT